MPHDELDEVFGSAESDRGGPDVRGGVGGGAGGGAVWHPAGGVGEVDSAPRRAIVLGPDLPGIVAEASAALAEHGQTWQRGGRLVGVAERASGPTVRVLGPGALRLRLAEAAIWQRATVDDEGRRKLVTVHPPHDVVAVVSDAGSWPVPELAGITSGPIVRPDGSVARSSGYDAATGWYSAVDPSAWVPDDAALCRESADVALGELADLTRDYPVASESDRSGLLSGLLTAIARAAIDGPVPLHLVHATTAGSGKSLWVDAVARIATGSPAPRMPPASTEDEDRKRITAFLLAGSPLILIDNVSGTMGGASMDALLTSRTWTDRLLGSTEMVTMPVTCAIFATGNNVTIRGDLARRTIPARIEPMEERPEERADLPDLEALVMRDRDRLLRAALTVILSYMREPARVSCAPMGSYSAWSRVCREPLIWLGRADPLEAQATMRGIADVAADTTTGLLSALMTTFGMGTWSTRDIAELGRDHAIRLAIEEAGMVRGPAIDARALGYWLRRTRGRRLGGMILQDAGTGHGHVRRWRVSRAEDQGAT